MALSPVVPALVVSLSLSTTTIPQPSAPVTVSVVADETDASAQPEEDLPGVLSSSGPKVFVMSHKPDPSRGVIKLVRHRNTTTTPLTSEATLITNTYVEVCTEPCGVTVDVSERPVFYFIRDGQPVTYGFRLHDQKGPVTLRVKPIKRGLWIAGAMFLVLLVGIPMAVAAAPKVWIANGRPNPDADFTKLKRARF